MTFLALVVGAVGLFGLAVPAAISAFTFRGADVDFAGIRQYGRME